MAIAMVVSLYTSRIVLNVLGASDYGLYNVVGGVVTMLSFLNGSLAAGTSRFLSYELGTGNRENLKTMFNVALVSHIALAFLIFILAETLGLWFLNVYMSFPADRTLAVNFVYQLSILTAMLQFTQVPYNSAIIAHEKMNVYAYVSILEVAIKLILVFLLIFVKNVDSLMFYSALMFGAQIIVITLYRAYCLRNYKESHWAFVRDLSQYKRIFSFSGWDIIGATCVISQGQGVNILLNIFFGPIVNAARAISYQIQGALSQLTGNFMTACNPQIVKHYARSEYSEMISLINNSSKYSYFLLLTTISPLLFKFYPVLAMWLGQVPDNTEVYSIIILITMMVRAIARPVILGVHACGNIKNLNLYAGVLGLMPLPLIYIGFKFLDWDAVNAFIVILVWGIFANVAEIILLKKELPSFSILMHLRSVYLSCLSFTVVIWAVVYGLSLIIGNNIFAYILYYLTSCLFSALILFCFGVEKNVRVKIMNIIKKKINAFNKTQK